MDGKTILSRSQQPSPPPPPPPPPPNPPKKQPPKWRRRLLGCMGVIAVFGCILVALGGGAYYMYNTGQLSVNDLLRMVNQAPAEISIINLTDQAVSARIERLNATGDDSYSDSLSLETYDINNFYGLVAGSYALEIDGSGLGFGLQTCTLNVSNGDIWQFAVVSQGIAIASEQYPATTRDEMDMATSHFCGH